MTLEEKIIRYRNIPKRIAELKIDKEICAFVKAVQYDSIGEGKGTSGNRTETKMVDAAAISAEIDELEKECNALKVDILQEINETICGDDVISIDMRLILKEHLLKGTPLTKISEKIVHRNYKTTRLFYQEGCEKLKIYH